MKKFNLCVIDDKIPVRQFSDKIKVNDTSIIEKSVLLNYVEYAQNLAWDDTNLYNLIKNLFEQKDLELEISGFTTHSLYINYIEEHLFSPDVIIFDWDVGTQDVPPEESLSNILENTYCLIAIYSGCDRIEEIESIINNDSFTPFNYRLFVIDKNEQESAGKILKGIKERMEDFSFMYGREFKIKINEAINRTFTKVGKLSFDQFVKIFGEPINNEYKISSLDFIEIMNEQIKAHLISSNSIEDLTTKKQSLSDDILIEKQLWHYRMFHEPKDDIVRKGDIVWHKKENRYFFIFSSDCHLASFWSKNLGYLTMIPLYKFDDQYLIKRIKYNQQDTLKQFKITSLVNPQKLINITIIPFLDMENDYILAPKEIKSVEVPKPSDRKILEYKDLTDFCSERRFRLNEPFLGALIDFSLRNITDIGVPDYSTQIKDDLRKYITQLGSKNEKT